MSLTYPTDSTRPLGQPIETQRVEPAREEPFVPVYARRGKARGGQGKIRTWMILVPVGVLALGGIGAMMAMNGGDEVAAPLAEPATTGPVLSALPTATPAVPLTTASTPGPVAAAPVVREAAAAPQPAAAPVRRAAARAPTPSAAPRVVAPAPAVPSGPQAYAPTPASPSTTTLNTAPATPAPAAPAPTPPVIIIEPVG